MTSEVPSPSGLRSVSLPPKASTRSMRPMIPEPETGHPDAPHAGGEVNAVIAARIAEKLLRAIYQVARPQAHKSDGKGRERGLGQDDHGLDERH